MTTHRRHTLFLRLVVGILAVSWLCACHGGGRDPGDASTRADASGDSASDASENPEPTVFTITTPTLMLEPGQNVQYCYFFRTHNEEELMLRTIRSHATPGVRSTMMFFSAVERGAHMSFVGNCGPDSMGGLSSDTLALLARDPDTVFELPSDDGTGNAVGIRHRPSQVGYLIVHYMNTTDEVLNATVEVDALAYDIFDTVTEASSFMAYQSEIDLSSGAKMSWGGTCKVTLPSGAAPKFFSMTTRTYMHSVGTDVSGDGVSVYADSGWSTDGMTTWGAPDFHTFGGGSLTYRCDYDNPDNFRITTGDRPAFDELCMVVGYFFPTGGYGSRFCLNSQIVQ